MTIMRSMWMQLERANPRQCECVSDWVLDYAVE